MTTVEEFDRVYVEGARSYADRVIDPPFRQVTYDLRDVRAVRAVFSDCVTRIKTAIRVDSPNLRLILDAETQRLNRYMYYWLERNRRDRMYLRVFDFATYLALLDAIDWLIIVNHL